MLILPDRQKESLEVAGRAFWRKPLAFAADAAGLWVFNQFAGGWTSVLGCLAEARRIGLSGVTRGERLGEGDGADAAGATGCDFVAATHE